jgi:hypothetical protein
LRPTMAAVSSPSSLVSLFSIISVPQSFRKRRPPWTARE